MAVSPSTRVAVLEEGLPFHQGHHASASSASTDDLDIDKRHVPGAPDPESEDFHPAGGNERHISTANGSQSYRKRAWRPKAKPVNSRSCRVANHQCDEHRPSRSRCSQNGRRCVYFGRILRNWTDTTQSTAEDFTEAATLAPHVHQFQIPNALRTTSTVIDPRYGKYFDQFRFHVAQQLGAGVFIEFWQRAVLRESASDQCILDAILALGSLDRARKSDPLAACTPLFAVANSPDTALRRKRWSEHYIAATTLYGQAIKAFQHRVTTRGASSRTALILTHILVAFEHFHGNLEAVDCLATRGLTLLQQQDVQAEREDEQGQQKRVVDDSPKNEDASTQKDGSTPTLASAIDDEGIRMAESLLQRIVSLNAMYSPMYPLSGRLVQASPSLPAYRLVKRPLPPFNVSSSVEELNSVALPLGTKVADWLKHAHRSVMMSHVKQEPLDPQLLDGQAFLLGQVTDLLEVLRAKLECSSDNIRGGQMAQRRAQGGVEQPLAPVVMPLSRSDRLFLERHRVGHDCSFVTVTAVLDPTGQTWTSLSGVVHDYLDRIGALLDDMAPEIREYGVLYDDLLGVCAFTANEARDYQVRRKAMARWARMLSPGSSWDNKSCFMATMALMAAEEAGRIPAQPHERQLADSSKREDPASGIEGIAKAKSVGEQDGERGHWEEHGVIPPEAQYMWTSGRWNESYTEYTVTLTPRLASLGLSSGDEPTTGAKEKTVVLDIEDFHFGRKGAGTLDAVGRLRRYLGK